MSMCNVLAVLGDSEDQMWETFDAAVSLAEAENARLTLAKTCCPGQTYVWMTPFACGGAYVPPPQGPEEVNRTLARVVARVPADLPVTTLTLGADTQRCLIRLLREGRYGALVAEADLLKHCRRLRRELRRNEIQGVPVPLAIDEFSSGDRIAARFTSSTHTEGGSPDETQITEGLGRGRISLRPDGAQRLAGAGRRR